jgi:hypothetical protein
MAECSVINYLFTHSTRIWKKEILLQKGKKLYLFMLEIKLLLKVASRVTSHQQKYIYVALNPGTDKSVT